MDCFNRSIAKSAEQNLQAPDIRLLASNPVLTEAGRRLVERNSRPRAFPKDQCLHRLFEAQAERAPTAIAIVFENDRITYRELNDRANRLAHHLRGLGVGPEVLVGLCVERSFELMIGLLAILKAGGAYLPLDPDARRIG